jgi:hypothetical protein
MILSAYQFVNENGKQDLFAFRFLQEQFECCLDDFFFEMQQSVMRTELRYDSILEAAYRQNFC